MLGTGIRSGPISRSMPLRVRRSLRTLAAQAYRDLVWEGLKVEPGPTRPGLTAADVAAIKEVARRKAAGFWAEGTTRTTVRKFAHDCIPTGPPVSSQPHALKGEAAQWVDDRLEEEVQRGQPGVRLLSLQRRCRTTSGRASAAW